MNEHSTKIAEKNRDIKNGQGASSNCDMDKWKRSFPNKDAFLRINFLHQASQMLAASSKSSLPCSCILSNTAKNVAQKLVAKLDPTLKRTVCRMCNTLLLPGYTSKVRIRGGAQKHLVVTCTECGSYKKYPVAQQKKQNNKSVKIRSGITANGDSVTQDVA